VVAQVACVKPQFVSPRRTVSCLLQSINLGPRPRCVHTTLTAQVIDGVPFAPDSSPALGQRFSSRSNTEDASSVGVGGWGRKEKGSSSKQGPAAKQKLTLSEMGMLNGAW